MCCFSFASYFLGNTEFLLLHLYRMHNHDLCRGHAEGISCLCQYSFQFKKFLVTFLTVKCSLAMSIFLLQGFLLSQPPWSLKHFVYFMHVNFPTNRWRALKDRQLMMTSCFAIHYGYSIDITAEASEILQSTGVT